MRVTGLLPEFSHSCPGKYGRIMELDDTLFKRALGELMVCAARSDDTFREIEFFLGEPDSVDLVRFLKNPDLSPKVNLICMEPSQLLLDFLETLRSRPCMPNFQSR